MRKLFLFLLVLVFLMGFVLGENCQLATPRYGTVKCYNTNQKETQSTNFGAFNGEWSTTEIPCLSNCEITSNGINIDCSGIPWDMSEVWLNDKKQNSFPIGWNSGDKLIIKGKCTIGITASAVPSDASIAYQQDKIMLEEGWGGSLEYTPIKGSEGCILNKDYDTTNIDSYLDIPTGRTQSKPDSTYSSLSQFPKNWEIGDHLIFIKDWQTGIADISLTYDKDNRGYWCGGQYGSRKIYSVSEINSNSNKCYAVPQSIYLSNVECCFPSDCVGMGAEYTCNPDNWKCEKTSPCNSQLECDSIFGEGICQNNQINQWSCDLTKKWGDYSGTCVLSQKEVSDCPSDCNSKEYYNEEQGKCLTRTSLQIKEADNTSGITGAVIGGNRGNSIWIIAIILLVLIGIILEIYLKKGNLSSASNGGKCCEDSKKAGKKFCIKCGKKI